jgi:hypothetical protein
LQRPFGWWSFDPQTASIHVRGGLQRKGEEQFQEYTEQTISAIADRFETLDANLYTLRSNIEQQRGDTHDFDGSPPPATS